MRSRKCDIFWRRPFIYRTPHDKPESIVADQGTVPIVYTIRGCDACVKLLKKWEDEGIAYDERRVELSQATLDEARRYGKLVPIVVWPDGRVEQGFGDSFGCFI